MPHSPRCTRHQCGARTEPRIAEFGRVVFACPKCERNKQGLCRECPAPLANSRCLRCPACAKRVRRERERRYDRERAEKRNPKRLAEWHRRKNRPEEREKRKAWIRAWRERNPRDEYDRAYGRTYMRKRRSDPTYYAQELERRRTRRAERMASTCSASSRRGARRREM